MVAITGVLVASACASSSSEPVELVTSVPDAVADSSTTSTTSATVPSTAPEDVVDGTDRVPNPLPIVLGAESPTIESEIGPAGGTIEATNGGTTFSLVIPPGAILDPVLIAMTPIELTTDAADLSLVTVGLAPDGLILLQPATLTVDAGFDERLVTVGFGADHRGNDAGFRTTAEPGSSKVFVSHFSIVGVAQASQAEIDRVLDTYTPTEREIRTVQELLTIYARVPAGNAQNQGIEATFEAWFGQIERDAESADDPGVVEGLFSEYISAVHVVSTMEHLVSIGASEPVVLEGLAEEQYEAARAIQDAMYRMFRQANLRCIQDSDPDQVFQMLKWAAFHEYLFEQGLGPEHRASDFEQSITQCMRFDVVFSSVSSTNVEDVRFDASVSAKVDLTFSDGENTNFLISQRTFKSPEIEGVLTGDAVGGSLGTCKTSAKIAVALDLSLRYPTGAAVTDAEIHHRSVLIRFLEPVNWDCGIAKIGQAPWFPWFHTLWADWNLGEGLYDFPLQQSGGGDSYGSLTKSGVITEGGGPFAVSFTVELKHNPQLP